MENIIKSDLNSSKKILILGCGWLGYRFANHLKEKDYSVFTTTTKTDKMELLQKERLNPFLCDINENLEALKSLFLDMDVIVITIPTPKNAKQEELIDRFSNLSKTLKGFENKLFMMSSVGVYQNSVGLIQEDSIADEFLNENIRSVEMLLKNDFPQINILRLGGLMGDNRVFNKFYTFKNPLETVNHVHYKDICLVVEKLMNSKIQGEIFNVVAPKHPTRQEVYEFQTLGKLVNHLFDEKNSKVVLSSKLSSMLDYSFEFDDPNTMC